MRFLLATMATIALLITSCAHHAGEICRTDFGRVIVDNACDSLATLLHIADNGDTLSVWPLHHAVYHYDYGDTLCRFGRCIMLCITMIMVMLTATICQK